jgi:hypothetical protein
LLTITAQYYELSFIPVTTLKLHFQMAEQSFKEALGDGLWVSIMDGKVGSSMINWSVQNKDQSFFHQLEGVPLELHSNKVTTLFNYARLLEELHDSVRASIFYRFIIFKVLLLLFLLASLLCYTNAYKNSQPYATYTAHVYATYNLIE